MNPNNRLHLIFLICLLLEVVVNYTAGTNERNARTTDVGTTERGFGLNFGFNRHFQLGSVDASKAIPDYRSFIPAFGRKKRSPHKEPAPAPAPVPAPEPYYPLGLPIPIPSWLPSLSSLPIPNIELPGISLSTISAIGGLLGAWGGGGGGGSSDSGYYSDCDYNYDYDCNYNSGWWGKRRKRSISGVMPPNYKDPTIRTKRHLTIVSVVMDIIKDLIDVLKTIFKIFYDAFFRSKIELAEFASGIFKSFGETIGNHLGTPDLHNKERGNLRGKRKAMLEIRRKKRSATNDFLQNVADSLSTLQDNIFNVVCDAYTKSFDATMGAASHVSWVFYDYWNGRSS